jgi:hypothetical protein
MDINTKVSMLVSHNVLLRVRHLDVAFRIFSYLKTNPRATYADIDYDLFSKENWDDLYGNAKEHVPPNALTPCGKPVNFRCYVDGDHAGDKLMRRS